MSTVTLTIVLPTARTDGTAISPDQIAKIEIFDSASPTPLVPIGTIVGAWLTFTTDVLPIGIHNFTAEVNDTIGHMSGMSNVASVTVAPTLANPNPPTITAVLNPS